MRSYEGLRHEMVSNQLRARGIRDERVLAAMEKVPREAFVPQHLKDEAYYDGPHPIGQGQTISQPYVVALMVEALALRGGEKALEIGAGSGYAAAVLAEIAAVVFAIERIGPLARQAATNLAGAGYPNVYLRHADGTCGWIEEAPFDGILVSAAAPLVPEPLQLQLAVGGRMILPVGKGQWAQELVRVTRRPDGQFDKEDLGGVRFVPLIGDHGWAEDRA